MAIDLENHIQNFVLETKKLEIPNHPHAFNPSIVFWRGAYLLSFRDLYEASPQDSSGYSHIGLVFLNNDLDLDSAPYILDFPGEDARLINVDEHLYIVCDGGFRMFIGELDFDGKQFSLIKYEKLTYFPQNSPDRREKNWVPFDYEGQLLLAYSLEPHQILYPRLNTSETCDLISTSPSSTSWPWGELRGGTPALRCGEDYLAFFHSSIDIATDHSNGEVVPHYFMGAYTFEKEFPFSLTGISPQPIIGQNFYHGLNYEPYWHPVRVVFPCGFTFDENYIWVVYRRQDHELWITKFDKRPPL